MKNIIVFLGCFLLLNCSKQSDDDSYKIYNTVLKDKVSTYGIIPHYLPYDKNYQRKELDAVARKIADSLISSKSLTFYLDHQLTILDTLNPQDLYPDAENKILTHQIYKYSQKKLDFSKIETLPIAKRVNKKKQIDETQKFPTYLGNYDLSEPVFITKNKAVIRYQHYCGGTCGFGLLIYLEKINNTWKISDEKMIWIS